MSTTGSGLWRGVDLYVDTSVSGEHTASTVSKAWDNTFLRNVGTHLQAHATSQPRSPWTLFAAVQTTHFIMTNYLILPNCHKIHFATVLHLQHASFLSQLTDMAPLSNKTHIVQAYLMQCVNGKFNNHHCAVNKRHHEINAAIWILSPFFLNEYLTLHFRLFERHIKPYIKTKLHTDWQ
jgi:hypothetical protein